jgi:hypothetical protein
MIRRPARPHDHAGALGAAAKPFGDSAKSLATRGACIRAIPAFLTIAWTILAASGSAIAQQVPKPQTPVDPAPPSSMPAAPAAPVPVSPQRSAPALVNLGAVFAGENKVIPAGLVWRILRDDDQGRPQIVQRSDAANPSLSLPPGSYIVHATYGFASASKRITLRAGDTTNERLIIGAGALRLSAAIGGIPIAPARVTFSIFVPIGNDLEGRLVQANVRPGDLVRVPEGNYHIVSSYGDTNAIIRTDLRVDSGRITDATIAHRAATVTLKLVTAPGGEALAGTAFSVLTPGGDVIREAIGAFPQVILAEGDYVVIARQDNRVHTREFKVETGLDRDIEVVAR